MTNHRDRVPEYRVLRGEGRGFIVKAAVIEYTNRRIHYELISPIPENGFSYYASFEDLQKLTPVTIDGWRVGFGDTVLWGNCTEYIITDFHWCENDWVLTGHRTDFTDDFRCIENKDLVVWHKLIDEVAPPKIKIEAGEYTKEELEKMMENL